MTSSTEPIFRWPLVGEFINRTAELNSLEQWWTSNRREPVAMMGRRRVGKSWLFRRFADGKPAVVLVSEQLPAGAQLARFADLLEPVIGVRPDLRDVPALFRVLFRTARQRQLLVVIDEFPWLLGTSSAEATRLLTSIQAVIEEERDESKLKLIVCGSQVAQMEALFGERNPMHGRLQRMAIRPLSFGESLSFFAMSNPVDAFERFAISGGMPMYLSRLAHGSLRHAASSQILDRNAPLWNEGRSIVEQELREPRLYFAILEQLAGGPRPLNEIAQPIGVTTAAVSKYLSTLVHLRLVSKVDPFGAAETSRSGRWQLDDSFLRFWFRFVFPFQSDLESGLSATDLFDAEVGPAISNHVAPVFEQWCLQWLRANRSTAASRFGTWWGNAANEFRRSKERSAEEIDGVGSLRNRITVISEAKWTNRQLSPKIVHDLDRYKIPALRQSGLRVVDEPRIVLFSRSGYTAALHDLAASDRRIELIDVEAALAAESP